MDITDKRTEKSKKPLISTNEIEIAIAKYYGIRQNIIVPNISWGFTWKDNWGWHSLHECDMFILKKSGYAVEVEIKRTKTDLLNDFKKDHNHSSNKIRELYYAIPKDNADEWSKLIPERAGIIIYWKEENIWRAKWELKISVYKKAKINRKAMKLTTDEQLKIAKLGCMRIWNLKEKLIKNEQNKK